MIERGGIGGVVGFTEAPVMSQIMLLARNFGYKLTEIAEAFGVSVDKVEHALKTIDPEGKVRSGLAQQVGVWKILKQKAEMALTPDKLDEESASNLVKIIGAAEGRIEALEGKMQGSTKRLTEKELENNVIKLIGGGDVEQRKDRNDAEREIGS
jgi:hypothetical protein